MNAKKVAHPRRVSEKADDKRRAAMSAFAKTIGEFRAASEVLKPVSSIRTVFPQFDHATGVGGWPLERFSMVHGPSGAGKTLFTIGLFGSFLSRGDRVLFLDLERTTPITWIESLISADYAYSKNFVAEKPDTIEQARDLVKKFLDPYIQLKEAGGGEGMSALVLVDSIAKLVPKDQFELLLKESAEDSGMDGMKGRGDQRRAGLVKSWLNEIVPDLEKSGASMGVIARETQDPNADFWAKKYGNDFRVNGGAHLFYDSSLVIRVQLAGGVYDDRGGEKKFLGERHRVTIRKSKVSDKDGKATVCYFHTSNGDCAPSGFDTARDLLELGVKLEVVESDSEDVAKGKRTIPGGKATNVHDLVRDLSKDPKSIAELDRVVREAFATREPEIEEVVL
jgi:RecA/RadA recombinase